MIWLTAIVRCAGVCRMALEEMEELEELEELEESNERTTMTYR
jgi:hypothetical protein